MGAIAYITHDIDKAKSADRVAWTHTLNCAHDDPAAALHEMLWTYRDADLLKQDNNIRAGGRPLEYPVKHITLSWHPSEDPTQEEMLSAVQSYLTHMKWQDHQAVLAAHNDTEHAHVHCILNAVHPETGLKLDDRFERKRTQEWALQYEREHGKIFCEERLTPEPEREQAAPRNVHDVQKAHDSQHKAAEEARQTFDAEFHGRLAANPDNAEWRFLKAQHRDEREAFFAEGKQAYRDVKKDVYQEVREEFRDRWAEYYAAKRDGLAADDLKAMRAGILEDQNGQLHDRQAEACNALRETRNVQYADILAQQRDERHMLHDNQAEGINSIELLADVALRVGAYDRKARDETTSSMPVGLSRDTQSNEAQDWGDQSSQSSLMEHGSLDVGGEPASASLPLNEGFGALTESWKMFGSIASVGRVAESLSTVFDFGPPARPEPRQPPPRPEFPSDNPFLRVASEARDAAEKQAKEERDRAYWDDRDRQRDR